jgi:hypothetical protein
MSGIKNTPGTNVLTILDTLTGSLSRMGAFVVALYHPGRQHRGVGATSMILHVLCMCDHACPQPAGSQDWTPRVSLLGG